MRHAVIGYPRSGADSFADVASEQARNRSWEAEMARAGLLGLLALPVPILLILIWALGWLH
jgi:hypothetical protein